MSHECDFSSDIEKGGPEDSLSSVFESGLVGFEVEGLPDKDFGFREVCGGFVMSEHEFSMFDEVVEILLDASCEESDSDT